MKHFYILTLIIIFNSLITNAQAIDYITGLDEPISLCLNGSDLIYSENNGNISTVDLTHINPIPTVLVSVTKPTWLVIYGTELYFADRGVLTNLSDGKIFKMDLASPNPTLTEVVFMEQIQAT